MNDVDRVAKLTELLTLLICRCNHVCGEIVIRSSIIRLQLRTNL